MFTGGRKVRTSDKDAKGIFSHLTGTGVRALWTAAVSLPWANQKAHDQALFTMSQLNLAVADDAFVNYLIIPDADLFIHTAFDITAEGKAYLKLFEAPTTSANGVAVTISNNNRATAVPTTTVGIFKGPTKSADGTLLYEGLVPGGTGNKTVGGSSSGLVRGGAEWVLAKGVKYLVTIENKGGSAKDIEMAMSFYESTDAGGNGA